MRASLQYNKQIKKLAAGRWGGDGFACQSFVIDNQQFVN
jgi:hypothetical protein